jgi:CBS domain-containing protein
MKTAANPGRVLGVSLELHYSWFVIALLLTLRLSEYLRVAHPLWDSVVVWTSATLIGLPFFFSAGIIQGVGQAAAARHLGLTVRGIALNPFACTVEIDQYVPRTRSRALIWAAGLLTNSSAGLIFLVLAYEFGWSPFLEPDKPFLSALVWLGYTNVALALLRVIPVLALTDGGLLRWPSYTRERSTPSGIRITATINEVVAFALMLMGILCLIDLTILDGLLLFFLGVFLLNAALDEESRREIATRLVNVRVADAMGRDYLVLNAGLDLKTAAEDLFRRGAQWGFVIGRDGSVIGVVSRRDLLIASSTYSPDTPLEDAVHLSEQVVILNPNAALVEALELMDREGHTCLPVGRGSQLVGMISRAQILDSGLVPCLSHISSSNTRGR